MSANNPSVSVVIPAWNAEETIQACLNAVVNQKTSSYNFEIIIVDDGSGDSTREIVTSYPSVKLVCQEHFGPAIARNLGAKNAVGEIILFTDADCVPRNDWIEKMVTPFDDENIVGVKGAYLNKQKSIVSRFVQLEYEEKYDRMEADEYIDFIDTYSAGYRKEVFLANGGFDKLFSSASVEDQEFSFRLSKLGYRMIFVRDAQVWHLRHANNIRDYFWKKFRIGYWKVMVLRRHTSKILRDSHTPQILKIQMIIIYSWFLALISGILYIFLEGSLMIFLWVLFLPFVLFVLTTLPFVAKAFRKDKLVALVSPLILLIRAFALGLGFLIGLFDTKFTNKLSGYKI